MKNTTAFSTLLRPSIFTFAAAAMLAGTFGTAITAAAQDFDDLQTPKGALVLKAQGSFYVGGSLKEDPNCPAANAGSCPQGPPDFGQCPPGIPVPKADNLCPIMADQMYVRYMKPAGAAHRVPMVLIMGAGLTGKTFETTPDGRMGWFEYFVRNKHDTYVVDPPWVGRSGFNYTRFQPPLDIPGFSDISTPSPERACPGFRISPEGDSCADHWPDTKFPVDHINELAKQGYPFFFLGSPFGPCDFVAPCSAVKELVTKLGAAYVFGHSFRGALPNTVARSSQTPAGNPVKATVNIDGCPGAGMGGADDAELLAMKDVAMLGVIGDHDEGGRTNGGATCQDFIDDFAAQGGFAEVIVPRDPPLNIPGNTHMMMMDENSHEIADIIIDWLKQHTDYNN